MTTFEDLSQSLHAAMTPVPDGAPDCVSLYDDEDRDGPHPWQVTDDGSASFALRKMGGAQRQIARVDAIRQMEQDRLDAWYARETAEARRTISFMEGRLLAYMRERLAADPKTRTIRFPGGTLSARRSTRVGVIDQDAVIAWAREHGYEDLVVKVTTEASVSGVKGLLRKDEDGDLIPVTEDGFAVPGVKVEVTDNPTATPAVVEED